MVMIPKKIILSFLSLYLANSIVAQPHYGLDKPLSIIPQPVSVKETTGNFIVGKKTKIYVDSNNNSLKKIAEMLSAQLKLETGYDISVNERSVNLMKDAIILTQNDAADTLGAEGYNLSVRPEKIVIKSLHPAGVFYGMQTLFQLLPVRSEALKKARYIIPGVAIIDKPRFGWRGMMLDVGRYFYSVDFIKKYIDYLAMHKMNTFHWHLTDDQGWRIEIKKYPKLTQLGAWREATQYDRATSQIDQNPHGGYYTQDQIREVVAYANDRFVNIVPEIEMPGHSLAALVAYPELSCTGGPFKIPLYWNIQKDVYCAGNEQTFDFLENVLTEVANLFPSPVIHIGGDECPKDRWKLCPKCQARMKAEGLKDEHELQSYFIRRIEKFLLTKNKRIIGWDEILEGGLAPNATVMSWRGIKGGVEAAKQHHDVVMSPTDFAYFDYYQGEPYHEPVAFGGLLTLEKVYSYEPVPAELNDKEALFIKGVQANVWSEFIHSPEKIEYMSFPRAAALAEVAWTDPKLKNWEDFKRRMVMQYKRYDSAGINYSKSAMNVSYTTFRDNINGTAIITLKTNSYQPEIRYTTDSTEPTRSSMVYSNPFNIKLPGTIKAAVFENGVKLSKVSVTSVLK
jgi:hexosaminidase